MSGFDFAVAAMFAFMVALRVLVVYVLSLAIIRPVRSCPACFADTVSVRSKWLTLLSASCEWRWCPRCRWQGPARKRKPVTARRPGPRRLEPVHRR